MYKHTQIMAYKAHELKTWPEYFTAVKSKVKAFEVRKDDRGFEVGDTLLLKEWNPDIEKYTGNAILAEISYILPGGSFGILPGYCVLGLARVTTLTF